MSHDITPIPGLGTLLQIKIGGVWTTIGQRVSIEGPDAELGIRDVTNLDSVYKGKRPTLPDLGKLTLKVFYDPNDGTHEACRARVFAPPSTPDLFQLIWNDEMESTHATDAISGFITKWTPNGMEVEETVGADVEIDLTDSYAFTAGS
jgi:hypothetical protein